VQVTDMRKYSNNKDICSLVRSLVSAGWRYHRGKKHGAIIAPVGKRVTIPSTPSDRRAYYNFRRDIRHLSPGGFIRG